MPKSSACTECESNRVPVAQAAKELGLDIGTVRYWIETGLLPIGRYVKRKGSKRGTYMIYRDKLDAELGRKGEQRNE